jgi:hypothetical protein
VEGSVTTYVLVWIALAREQPMGIDPRDVYQFQNDVSRHCDACLIVEPGFKTDLQGVGEELGAVFPTKILANLAEALGQLQLPPTVPVVIGHAAFSVLTD